MLRQILSDPWPAPDDVPHQAGVAGRIESMSRSAGIGKGSYYASASGCLSRGIEVAAAQSQMCESVLPPARLRHNPSRALRGSFSDLSLDLQIYPLVYRGIPSLHQTITFFRRYSEKSWKTVSLLQ